MKYYKKIDFYLQVILITGSIIRFCINPEYDFSAYLLVGGWQVISTLVHLFADGLFYPARHRRAYGLAVLGFFAVGLISLPMFYLYFMAAYYITPLYAFWYLHICFQENQLISKKELIHLK